MKLSAFERLKNHYHSIEATINHLKKDLKDYSAALNAAIINQTLGIDDLSSVLIEFDYIPDGRVISISIVTKSNSPYWVDLYLDRDKDFLKENGFSCKAILNIFFDLYRKIDTIKTEEIERNLERIKCFFVDEEGGIEIKKELEEFFKLIIGHHKLLVVEKH